MANLLWLSQNDSCWCVNRWRIADGLKSSSAQLIFDRKKSDWTVRVWSHLIDRQLKILRDIVILRPPEVGHGPPPESMITFSKCKRIFAQLTNHRTHKMLTLVGVGLRDYQLDNDALHNSCNCYSLFGEPWKTPLCDISDPSRMTPAQDQ